MSSIKTQLINQTLKKGRYQILRKAGKGGWGTVYLAKDASLRGLFVAIKEMTQSSAPEAVENFHREAQILRALQNLHLPRFHDFFEEDGRWYLVMDFIEGETLKAYVDRSGYTLPLLEALEIGIQLCDVLHYLHTHHPPIVFRDLKPTNIMITASGHIFLIDFGIALYFKEGKLDPEALGTAGYAPPDQCRGESSPLSDIYALGATVHYMCTGKLPSSNAVKFEFDPLGSDIPELDGHPSGHMILQELNTLLIQNMLNHEPKLRPASIELVKQELQRIARLFSDAIEKESPEQRITPFSSIIFQRPATSSKWLAVI